MNIFVAGGAGYVGSVLVRRLLDRGYGVTICDPLFYGDDGIAEIMDCVDLVREDIRFISPRQLEGMDAVVNLAGISCDPTAEYQPALTYEMNVSAAIALARFCLRAGVRRYVYASSCSVYAGNACEASDVLFDERAAVSPVSTYARSKRHAEQELLRLADQGLVPVCLRKGTVYGLAPRMRFDLLVNSLLKTALTERRMVLQGGGEMWRPIVHVNDVVAAYVACLEAEQRTVCGRVFNVVFANFRVSEIALRIRETLRVNGIEVDLRCDYETRPIRSYRVSGEIIQEALGLRPHVTIEEAISQDLVALREWDRERFGWAKYFNIRMLDHIIAARGQEVRSPADTVMASAGMQGPQDRGQNGFCSRFASPNDV